MFLKELIKAFTEEIDINWKDVGGDCLAYLAAFGIFMIIPTIVGLIWGPTALIVAMFIQGWFGTFFL